jgi:uncharacterized protein YgbK (DUF1537 family)
VCADALPHAGTAVFTGGATASRAVLAAAGTMSLRLLGQMEPGVVLSLTGDGDRERQVVTKSGSFGVRATLVRLASLATAPPHHGGHGRRPRTARCGTPARPTPGRM